MFTSLPLSTGYNSILLIARTAAINRVNKGLVETFLDTRKLGLQLSIIQVCLPEEREMDNRVLCQHQTLDLTFDTFLLTCFINTGVTKEF